MTQLLEARRPARGRRLWQFRRKQAAESGKGRSDLIASASRALQLERVESQKRLPRESCSCAGLSPSFTALDWNGFARLGFASGLRVRSCLGRRGADGCNDFERVWGQS